MGVTNFEFRFDTPLSTAEGRGTQLHKIVVAEFAELGLREFEHVDGTGQERRLVKFSDVCDLGATFSWDPGEVTDPINHEMAIYLDGGRGDWDLFRRAGSTFLEVLVNEILRGPYNREVAGYGLENLQPLGAYLFNHVPDMDFP